MITIAVSNKKGGVGKTTTAYNLATGLQHKGKKTILIDLDSQCSLTEMLGIYQEGPTSYGILTKETTIQQAILHTEFVDFIQGSPSLNNLDGVLPEGFDKMLRLRRALAEIKDNYDFCVLDCPPAVSVVTANAITAADYIVCPAESSALSTDGVASIFASYTDVKLNFNPNIIFAGVLLTRYQPNTVLGREYAKIFEELAARMDSKLFKTKIRQNVNLSEQPSLHLPIFDYKPDSSGSEDYNAFINELLKDIKKHEAEKEKKRG